MKQTLLRQKPGENQFSVCLGNLTNNFVNQILKVLARNFSNYVERCLYLEFQTRKGATGKNKGYKLFFFLVVHRIKVSKNSAIRTCPIGAENQLNVYPE